MLVIEAVSDRIGKKGVSVELGCFIFDIVGEVVISPTNKLDVAVIALGLVIIVELLFTQLMLIMDKKINT